MKKIKFNAFFLLSAIFLTALAASNSFAENSNQIEFAIVSDYVSRGVSYSDEKIAIQGGISHSHASGVYLGAWSSTVDFNSDAKFELDVYVGHGLSVEQINVDYGLAYYTYPQETVLNYGELYLGLAYSIFSSKISVSNDYSGTGGASQYLEVNADWSFNPSWTINGHAGYHRFEKKIGLDNYSDVSLGVLTQIYQVDLSVYVANAFSDSFGKIGDARVVASVSKSIAF